MPSRARLIAFAVLLPAALAGTNQLLFALIPQLPALSSFLYPWMALSTAVLSWCTGRYLSPAWLRWIVFAWCLTLLDFLTIAACLGYGVENHFGYVLVSSQISLIVLWAIVGSASWQWRLPAVLAAAAAVLVFAGSFEDPWNARVWNLLMILATAVILLLSGVLRLRGFRLQGEDRGPHSLDEQGTLGINQFGLKHMLIWATALVPILLVVKSLDFLVLKHLGGLHVISVTLVAIIVATVNLIAVWSVLGQGFWILRVAVLLVLPYLFAIGLSAYLAYLESVYNPTGVWTLGNPWNNSLVRDIVDVRGSLVSWLWLDAALLAALLLFLRASGYRLMRTPR